MDEGFALSWHDAPSTVVHREEVICGIDNGCAIMQVDNEAHDSYEDVCQEVVVQDVEGETIVPEVTPAQTHNTDVVENANIMYLSAENVFVMQPPAAQSVVTFQDNFMECQVTEEVITDDWVNSNSEERVEIPVGEVGAEEQIEYDSMEVPLPIDQDEYTASRPYPCDFCSRRFRKKANLMNHMVAHQTDRPHGCNLCGARYIRKCDLMNHLKIHAYVPEPDALEDEDELPTLSEPEDSSDKRSKSRTSKSKSKRKAAAAAAAAAAAVVAAANTKSPKIKKEYEDQEYESSGGGGGRSTYNYVEEDVRLLSEMEGGQGTYGEVTAEVRYPIVDPRKPFVCQHCGVAFAREKALASHAKVHAGDSPFECESCQEMFWDVAVLREHVRTKHGGGSGAGLGADSDYEDVDDDDYVEDSKYGEFYCKVCGVRFHRMDLLRRHMRMHDDIKQEAADFGHVCNTCGQSFSEALDLLAHAEVHARHADARCMLCGECFADEQATAAHIQQRHAKSMPPNTCMLCGKTCKDRRTLLKHSWEHSREKLFCCSKCGKCFHNKARLKRHMVSHRNKAVQCDVCGEDFPDGRSLMNHRHSHTNLSGRQFPCRECGKTFGSRSSQQIHIRIHTGERPYGCRFCWKAFADGGTLRKHERIHTGEKPYACAVCPRAFNQRVVLREHIRSHHSGPDPHYSHTITPFCCAVCNDLFSTSQDLILHLIHHCDLNTALKRQPQVGPRKYKRRRKLKPHELEIISSRSSAANDDHDGYSDSDERTKRRVGLRKARTPPAAASQSAPHQPSPPPQPPNKSPLDKDYEDMFQSFETAIQHMNSIVNSKPVSTRGRKKTKPTETASTANVPSRPKMIHTQKTRVPVESAVDGRVRHRTKTLITRTTPSEHVARDKANQAAASERNRPRTKNVSYHVQQAEKLPLATFGDTGDDDGDDSQDNKPSHIDLQSVSIKQDPDAVVHGDDGQANGIIDMEFEEVETEIPDVANEETVLAQVEEPANANSKQPTAVSMIKVTKNFGKRNSLTPGRHIIGPGNKVIRIVKGGMLVSNKVKREPEYVVPDLDSSGGGTGAGSGSEQIPLANIKQELVEPSPLHELAELSMQHAQNQFRCEMCSATFTDRSQLLMHVPIHI